MTDHLKSERSDRARREAERAACQPPSDSKQDDPFFGEGAAPVDLIDDLPGSRELTDELVEEAYSTFVVAMQRTGTTRKAMRAALEAVWSRRS